MGGLLSEKFLDANISVPFAGPSLNTPSLNKYKQVGTWDFSLKSPYFANTSVFVLKLAW